MRRMCLGDCISATAPLPPDAADGAPMASAQLLEVGVPPWERRGAWEQARVIYCRPDTLVPLRQWLLINGGLLWQAGGRRGGAHRVALDVTLLSRP